MNHFTTSLPKEVDLNNTCRFFQAICKCSAYEMRENISPILMCNQIVKSLLGGHSSPGFLHLSQKPSNGCLQIAQVSSFTSHFQAATACHLNFVTLHNTTILFHFYFHVLFVSTDFPAKNSESDTKFPNFCLSLLVPLQACQVVAEEIT